MIEVEGVVDPYPPTVGRLTRQILESRDQGRPITLTIDGLETLTVADGESIQKLIELIDELETVEVLRERIASRDRGEQGYTLAEARVELNRRRGRSV